MKANKIKIKGKDKKRKLSPSESVKLITDDKLKHQFVLFALSYYLYNDLVSLCCSYFYPEPCSTTTLSPNKVNVEWRVRFYTLDSEILYRVKLRSKTKNTCLILKDDESEYLTREGGWNHENIFASIERRFIAHEYKSYWHEINHIKFNIEDEIYNYDDEKDNKKDNNIKDDYVPIEIKDYDKYSKSMRSTIRFIFDTLDINDDRVDLCDAVFCLDSITIPIPPDGIV